GVFLGVRRQESGDRSFFRRQETGVRRQEGGRGSKKETGLTQIYLESAICRGECHSPSLYLVSVGDRRKKE
ncbi:hypothetical protein, partial [Okeania sp. SIO2B9]|uniref:hypothetical protein n=1 Tax=Okeania sp. SIO2B9 TaxID=2607782 RepID=UPI001428E335